MRTCQTLIEENSDRIRKPIPNQIRFKVFRRDLFTCQYCGRTGNETILEVDHVIPHSKGGSDHQDNLITSCRDCNRGKSDMQVIETNLNAEQIDIERERIAKELQKNKEDKEKLQNPYLDSLETLARVMQEYVNLEIKSLELEIKENEIRDPTTISDDEVRGWFEDAEDYDENRTYTKADYIKSNGEALKSIREEHLNIIIDSKLLNSLITQKEEYNSIYYCMLHDMIS